MGVKTGHSKHEHTFDEKVKIVQEICDLYGSQHCTLVSACKIAGISERTFFLWRYQNSDFAEMFKKARENQKTFYWEDVIQPLADSAIVTLLRGGTAKERKIKKERDGHGNLVITEKVTTRKEILPNAATAIFINKGLYPDRFVDHSSVENNLTIRDDTMFMSLPLERRLQIMDEARAAKVAKEAAQKELNDEQQPSG